MGPIWLSIANKIAFELLNTSTKVHNLICSICTLLHNIIKLNKWFSLLLKDHPSAILIYLLTSPFAILLFLSYIVYSIRKKKTKLSYFVANILAWAAMVNCLGKGVCQLPNYIAGGKQASRLFQVDHKEEEKEINRRFF